VKTLAWWGSRGYLARPTISFILHNHNMSEQSKAIVDDLRMFKDCEIIVLDDGSTHEHTRALADHMDQINEFVVHSNDLFDVIMFNKVIRFASGKFVVILQDDDYYKGKEWAASAMELFARDPQMAILGGRHFISVSVNGKVKADGRGTFHYAQVVNAAPMWIRRDAFMDLGGFDLRFAPMLWHEGDLCIRAWLEGYTVGWYMNDVRTLAVNTRDRRSQKEVLESEATVSHFNLFMNIHGSVLEHVQELVKGKNEGLR